MKVPSTATETKKICKNTSHRSMTRLGGWENKLKCP